MNEARLTDLANKWESRATITLAGDRVQRVVVDGFFEATAEVPELVAQVRRLRAQAETDTYDLDHLRADVVERDREIARLRAALEKIGRHISNEHHREPPCAWCGEPITDDDCHLGICPTGIARKALNLVSATSATVSLLALEPKSGQTEHE